MNLLRRIALLEQLGKYMMSDEEAWALAKEEAYIKNPWFLPEFINLSIKNIAEQFLQKDILTQWIERYQFKEPAYLKNVGVVMAGNIPLVGFHDFLCVFITGNKCVVKTSSKDDVLIKHLTERITEWEPEATQYIEYAELLKNCDAYIATGSNHTAGFFEYYFRKYHSLIRRNKTSAAILIGNETEDELDALADDVHLYFGMGCRNVTKLYVPEGYNFEPLLNVFKKYHYFSDLHKYKNNYDYNLALHLLNNEYYMSTGSLLVTENKNLFSPISELYYECYADRQAIVEELQANQDIQCITGKEFIPFGHAQCPVVDQYADGEDTIAFLL